MNRQEAMKIIESNRIYYRDFKHEEFDEALDRLKQPLTLAEFLGWEEDVEYRRGGNILKVEGNHLLDKRPDGKFHNTNCSAAELIDLRNATKYEFKYYAKIKGWEKVSEGESYYWTLAEYRNKLFISYKTEEPNYMTKFTKEEWAELGITDENADFEEVK